MDESIVDAVVDCGSGDDGRGVRPEREHPVGAREMHGANDIREPVPNTRGCDRDREASVVVLRKLRDGATGSRFYVWHAPGHLCGGSDGYGDVHRDEGLCGTDTLEGFRELAYSGNGLAGLGRIWSSTAACALRRRRGLSNSPPASSKIQENSSRDEPASGPGLW